jgi:hypothetical protein
MSYVFCDYLCHGCYSFVRKVNQLFFKILMNKYISILEANENGYNFNKKLTNLRYGSSCP